MTLSIIIVNYNTSQLTKDCIDSIRKFRPNFLYEVIVVDNASVDDSVKKLSSIKNITFIQNSENLGFAKANNIGIKKSKGRYVLLLNSDTKIINHVFDELVSFAENTTDAGVIAPKLLNPDQSLQPSIFKLPTIARAVKQYWFGQEGILDKYGLTTHEPEKVEAVVGAAFLITPKARKLVGLMSEKYFMYFEDLDYCREVNRQGLSVYYLPCSYLIHIHGASGGGKTNKLLIDASKLYFGLVQYYMYTFVLWSGQKFRRTFL